MSPPTPIDAHDERRLRRVRPPDWQNPVPASRYDLVVVGAGTAGLVAAAVGAGLGAKVALIERGLLGGDCLNVGCVPSKALLRAARAAADARDAARFGVRATAAVQVDFGVAMERMRRVRAELSAHDSAERFRDLGVDVFLGEGRFVASDRITVGGASLRFRRAVIATGASPVAPPIPGLEAAGYLTNETVFDLVDRPASLAVVGGGPIGCELAQAFARLGVPVALVERKARVLARDDADAGAIVQAALRRDGVALWLERDVERVERGRAGRRLVLAGGGAVEVEHVLVAVGRAPNVAGLGLDAAGVAWGEERGIAVDDRLRTSNRRIYAAGDIVGEPRFTHVSDAQARIAVRNALFPGARKNSALTVPWVTYTDPEVAHVGHTERTAREAGLAVDTYTQELSTVDRAVLEGATEGFARVHVRAGTGEIVGGTIVAPHAGETISELTLAIEAGADLATLSSTIHPYPTVAEALRKIGDQYQRTRLTPAARWLVGKWLSILR